MSRTLVASFHTTHSVISQMGTALSIEKCFQTIPRRQAHQHQPLQAPLGGALGVRCAGYSDILRECKSTFSPFPTGMN